MAAASQTPTGGDFETSFLSILNNRSKQEEDTRLARQRGFVVVVRGSNSLKPLQDLCLNPERQQYNTCYTARYRLQPKMAMGTLLAAWIRDFTKIHEGQKGLGGDLRMGPVGSTHPNATKATMSQKTSA